MGAGVVQLKGIPAWHHRVLVAAFRDGVPVGMSALRADIGNAVSIHLGSGTVTAEVPADGASPAIDTVRIERLYQGTELADFAFGPLAHHLEFRLHRMGSGLSRDNLLAYAWYSVVGAEDGPHFYLDAGELKNLGDLGAPEILTLVVEGPVSTQGWATYDCWVKGLGEGRTLITGSGRFDLWLPGPCQAVDGEVRIGDWPSLSFQWLDTHDRQIKVRMRRAGVIRGLVHGPGGRRLGKVSVSATWQYPLELDELVDVDDAAELEELIEKYPLFLDPNQKLDGPFTHFEHRTSAGTTADGSFSLSVPFNGEYLVAATHDDYYAPSVDVALDSGLVTIEMQEAASLVGVVRNTRGQPVEARLHWSPVGQDTEQEPSGWTDADADGVFRFPTLPPGRTEVTEVAADGTFFFENMSPGIVKLAANTESHASRTVELVIEPTDTVRQVTLELFAKSGRITGRIESAVSLAGADVFASTGLNHASAPISASGEFHLSDLPVGTWSLDINHWGLANGQDAYVDVATVDIPREGVFRYVLVDLTTQPTLTLSGGPPGERVTGAGGVKLDENGGGVLRVPRAGTYQLVWRSGNVFFYKKVTIEGGTTVNLADPPDRTEPVPRFQC